MDTGYAAPCGVPGARRGLGHHRGHPVELGRRQERFLLGLLLLEPGRVLRTERLIELLWSDVGVADRRSTLHTYVARLRRRLAPTGSASSRAARAT
ncbi:helix-turn-helix domain-containing protein [Micromonospora sp. M12]